MRSIKPRAVDRCMIALRAVIIDRNWSDGGGRVDGARHEGVVLVVEVEVRQVSVLHVAPQVVAQASCHSPLGSWVYGTQHWGVQLVKWQVIVRSSRGCICDSTQEVIMAAAHGMWGGGG